LTVSLDGTLSPYNRLLPCGSPAFQERFCNGAGGPHVCPSPCEISLAARHTSRALSSDRTEPVTLREASPRVALVRVPRRSCNFLPAVGVCFLGIEARVCGIRGCDAMPAHRICQEKGGTLYPATREYTTCPATFTRSAERLFPETMYKVLRSGPPRREVVDEPLPRQGEVRVDIAGSSR